MWFHQLTTGILIGLLASMPLGPSGVINIQRTLSKSQFSGFFSGVGVALADTVFAAVALLSLRVVMGFIESHLVLIKALGGICVIIVGMTILLKNPLVQIKKNRAGKGDNLVSDLISMFFISLANPLYILVSVALLAAFGVSHDGTLLSAGSLLTGVFGGAILWWFVLTAMISLLRKRFRPRHLLWMNRISGAVIVVLGAVAIISIFFNTPL